MHSVEKKLSSWHKVYRALQDARARLERGCQGQEQEQLQAEVRRLQLDSDSALAEVQGLLSRRRVSGGTSPRE